ncbi:hypothetical protein BN000_00120 [Mycobacterium europaeum]|uniref:Uncharacterized protein n=1 Tax=Mycobacterium europaeum TaxID=761804 RepID=A0A0U1CW92_9MYCO|nr:hypothetical protein BN000_00120 [Mycobacterium europaeum]
MTDKTSSTTAPHKPTKPKHSLAVRKLAAQTAVAASKKSGRPVDPRVQKLADS